MHDDQGIEITEYAGTSATCRWTLEWQIYYSPLELAPMAMWDEPDGGGQRTRIAGSRCNFFVFQGSHRSIFASF